MDNLMENGVTLVELDRIYNKIDMIGIYKITNPNGKVYIGQAVNIKNRISKYKWLSAAAKQPKIFRSLQKHGWENHNWEVLEECELDKLDELEAFHKQNHIDESGWGEALFCQIHDAVRGKSLPQSTKDKIGKSNTGKVRSEEAKKRMIESRTRGIHCKPCFQYDLNGKFLKKWEFREDAAKAVNGETHNISSTIIGRQKTAHGYQWTGTFKKSIKPVTRKARPIVQLDLEGNEIKRWERASDAEGFYNPKAFERTKYGSTNINSCMNKKQSTAYGFKWERL
jgi:group I intron endonuclease